MKKKSGDRKFRRVWIMVIVFLGCLYLEGGVESRIVQAEPQIVISDDAQESIGKEPEVQEGGTGSTETILTQSDQKAVIPAGEDGGGQNTGRQEGADGQNARTQDAKIQEGANRQDTKMQEESDGQKGSGVTDRKREDGRGESAHKPEQGEGQGKEGEKDFQKDRKQSGDQAGKDSEEQGQKKEQNSEETISNEEKTGSLSDGVDNRAENAGIGQTERTSRKLTEETAETEEAVETKETAETEEMVWEAEPAEEWDEASGITEYAKTGIAGAFVLVGMGFLFWLIRQRSVFLLFAKGQNGIESRVGSLRAFKKEDQYVLEIPAEMLFAQKEEIYRLRPNKLFYRLCKGKFIYVSCMGRSFEAKIDRQITFSI